MEKTRKKASEIIVFVLGLVILLINFYFIKIPPTLRRVNIIEGYILKITVLLIGIFFIVFSIISLFSKSSLIFNKKTKKIALNILILSISIFICLLILEIFLQLTSEDACQKSEDILHHSYIPNCSIRSKTMEWDITAEINSDGLRDEEIKPREDYDYRILVLGDSFTIGWGVEHKDAFSEILQERLNKAGIKTDVLNAGVTSYSPLLEYLYLREIGLKYKPDIVIINFDMGDIQGDNYYTSLAQVDSEGKIIGVKTEKENNLLVSIYKKIKVIKLLEMPFIILDSKLSGKVLGSSHFYNLDYDAYMLTRGEIDKEEAVKYFHPTFNYLKLINQLSKENNITFILSTYPYGHQVSGEEWAEGRHNFGFDAGKVYSNLPEEILREFAEENNIHFISMFPHLKESEIFPLYFPYDGHFNEEGHELAAEVLFNDIVGMDLFEEKTELLVKRENNSYWKANGNILYNK